MGRSPGDEGERVDLVSIREGEVRERREGVRRKRNSEDETRRQWKDSSRVYDRHRFLASSSSSSNYCNDIIKRLIANANTASSTSGRRLCCEAHQQRAARHRSLS